MQAALLMYALDISSGRSADLQAIALEKRLPALISACRRLQLTSLRHENGEDWNSFLHSDQIIRVVIWTFSADGLATLCYNQPPQFAITEMCGDLPCQSALFDATEPPIADGWRYTRTCHTVAALIPSLMADSGWLDGQVSPFPVIHTQAILCGKCNSRTLCAFECSCLDQSYRHPALDI